MGTSGFTHESAYNESVEWYTPPSIFDALGVTFDMDVCSPGEGKTFVPAKRYLTVEDNGLITPWDGLVWCNPPYGTHTPVWMRRMAEHGNGLALVFARTDVKWFQEIASGTNLICFVSGRIRFYQGSVETQGGSPGSGSMLLAWGDEAGDILRRSGLGIMVTVG